MKSLLASIFVVVGSQLMHAQGAFQNLDFESANVTFATGGVAMSNALPGWTSSWGTNQIAYNPSLLGVWPGIALLGSNEFVLAGNFDVYLRDAVSISQTGLVPNGTESLLFDASTSPSLVSIGGQSLSFMAISNALNSYGHSYTVYGADISVFAGQIETVTFSGSGLLDNIQFSPQAIPEPSAISFFCLGSGVLFYVRHRRRVL